MTTRPTAQPSLIGGAMPIAGGDDAEGMQKAGAAQMAALILGFAYLEIPLSGGSDTRRGVRECWEERCAAWGVPCKAVGGHTLIIGRKAR